MVTALALQHLMSRDILATRNHLEPSMLRFSIALLVAIAVSETAESADRAPVRQGSHHGWRRATVILPPGLPRPHYNFRTTISYGRAPAYVPYWDRRPYACSAYGYC